MAQSVIVLGGGIIGLSCAFEAARRGMRVTLLEPHAIGGQASGAAAGMLAPYSENTEQPDAFFQLCLQSLRRYPEWVDAVEQVSGLDAEWIKSGSVNVFLHEADMLPVQSRLTWQNRYGAKAELIGPSELRKLEPQLTMRAAAGIYTPEESHIYAPKLVAAAEEGCRKLNVALFPFAGAVERIAAHQDGGVSVRMSGLLAERRADRLVVCAGAWSGAYERWFDLSIPVHPIRGQICSFDNAAGEVRHMVFSSQGYWVGKKNNRLVCGASEDAAGFDTTVTERGIGRLLRSSGRFFPVLEGRDADFRWAGLRPATRDGLPLIGQVKGHSAVIMAAGHYRNGILLSPITARLVGDLLEEKQPELPLGAFSPHRFAPSACG